MDRREQPRGPLHHEIDLVSIDPVTTSCGVDLPGCFDLARQHGDTFAWWDLQPLSINTLPENACPRCVREITLGHVEAALSDAERVLRHIGERRAAARVLAAWRVLTPHDPIRDGARRVSR